MNRTQTGKEKCRLQTERPVATWVWNVFQYMVNPKKLFRFCRENGVTELYLYIKEELTGACMARFIRQCHENGIRAIALCGEPEWGLPNGRPLYECCMEQVDRIQKACGDGPGFAALHFDVAPYQLYVMAAALGKQKMADRILELLYDARGKADALGLPLEWDIPVWYSEYEDEKNSCTLADTILKVCDRVTVMGFRNSFSQQWERLQDILKSAKRFGTPLMIGYETIDSPEAHNDYGHSALTYYGFGKRYLYRSMYRMEKSIVAFGLEDFGFAVHDVSRWQTLSEETLPDYREELEHELQLEHA